MSQVPSESLTPEQRGEAANSAGGQIEADFLESWGERLVVAWNALDGDAVASLCSEDIVWRDPGLSEPARGRVGVRDFVSFTARVFPDFHVESTGPLYISPIEPVVLAPYRMSGTMLGGAEGFAPTNGKFSVAGVDEWTFRGDLMCNYTTYYDGLDLARQLGLFPSSGSNAERAIAWIQHIQARFQRRSAARR